MDTRSFYEYHFNVQNTIPLQFAYWAVIGNFELKEFLVYKMAHAHGWQGAAWATVVKLDCWVTFEADCGNSHHLVSKKHNGQILCLVTARNIHPHTPHYSAFVFICLSTASLNKILILYMLWTTLREWGVHLAVMHGSISLAKDPIQHSITMNFSGMALPCLYKSTNWLLICSMDLFNPSHPLINSLWWIYLNTK